MAIERLLAGAAVAALISGSALAQTGGSTMQPSSAPGTMSPSSAAQPYAAPPTTGGMAEPSAAGNSMGSMSNGSMSNGSMSGGSMSSGSMSGGAMGSTSSFTPIQATGGNIVAELTASGEFTKLVAALKDTNLTTLVSTHPNLTLFAPTDAAFAALPPGQLDTLMKSPAQLQAILTYHLVATTLKESDIKGHAAGKVQAADKKSLTIDGSGATIKVNEAMVLQSAVPASNGEIYPIDKVLMPPAS